MLFSVPFGAVLKGISSRRLSLPSSAPRIQVPKLDLQFLPFPARRGLSEITSTQIKSEVTELWGRGGSHVGQPCWGGQGGSFQNPLLSLEAGRFERGSALLTHRWLLSPAQQRCAGLPGPQGEVCRESPSCGPAVGLSSLLASKRFPVAQGTDRWVRPRKVRPCQCLRRRSCPFFSDLGGVQPPIPLAAGRGHRAACAARSYGSFLWQCALGMICFYKLSLVSHATVWRS